METKFEEHSETDGRQTEQLEVGESHLPNKDSMKFKSPWEGLLAQVMFNSAAQVNPDATSSPQSISFLHTQIGLNADWR